MYDIHVHVFVIKENQWEGYVNVHVHVFVIR